MDEMMEQSLLDPRCDVWVSSTWSLARPDIKEDSKSSGSSSLTESGLGDKETPLKTSMTSYGKALME